MKDFFDLWVLFTKGSLDRALLPAAVRATFERRGTALPADIPPGLGDAFVRERLPMWNAFVTRNNITAPPFEEVVALLRKECLPLLQVARSGGEVAVRPLIVAEQVREGVADFLATTFPVRESGKNHRVSANRPLQGGQGV